MRLVELAAPNSPNHKRAIGLAIHPPETSQCAGDQPNEEHIGGEDNSCKKTVARIEPNPASFWRVKRSQPWHTETDAAEPPSQPAADRNTHIYAHGLSSRQLLGPASPKMSNQWGTEYEPEKVDALTVGYTSI
jgi:hypothetical protein